MVQFFVLQISCNVCIPLRGQCSIGHSRHRADEYGVFLMNFALSYGYFQSALGWLRSILLAHFWYVRIMLSSIRDSAGEKYSLEILSTFTVLLLISVWHFLRHMFDVLAFQLFTSRTVYEASFDGVVYISGYSFLLKENAFGVRLNLFSSSGVRQSM